MSLEDLLPMSPVHTITDEENWSPPNGTYGNESIVAQQGTMAEFTLKYRF